TRCTTASFTGRTSPGCARRGASCAPRGPDTGSVSMPSALTPGALFAHRFEIERAVGSGGMGTVYRARDVSSGGLVALKVLSEVTPGLAETARFVREDLSRRLARGPLRIGDAVALLRHLSEALCVAHERGVVHRDVKPQNLF